MKKTLLIAALTLSGSAIALGFAGLAFQRARKTDAALSALLKKRAALDARVFQMEDKITALDRDRGEFEATLGKLRADQAAGSTASKASGLPDLATVLAANPKVYALWANSYRAGLGQRFGPFYQDLGLSPDQIAEFQDLMTSSAEAAMDLRAVALSQGLNDFAPAIAALRQRNDDQLRTAQIALLGEEGYQRLQQFSRTQPVQGIVGDAASLVALSPTPLTFSQAERLMQILADADPPDQNGGSAEPTIARIDWHAALAQAQGILSPSQFAALRVESEAARSARLLYQFFQQPAAQP